MPVAISVPFIAMARRSREVLCGVSAAKSAATSSGPMVAKKVVRATSAASIMGGTRRGRAAASWQGAVAASSGAAGDDGAVPCAMVERGKRGRRHAAGRSEEHTSELQSLMRSSYAVFCLKKKKETKNASN